MSNFLENRHPDWEENKEKWHFSWSNYTGEYANHDRLKLYKRGKNKLLKSDQFLHRKVQAETEEAYLERIATSDPIMLFPTAVDSLNGIIKEEKTQRSFGDLGRVEPEDDNDTDYKDTVAYKLWNNADYAGTNWVPLMKQAGIKQTVLHTMWALVDGIKERSFENEEGEEQSEVIGDASIHLLDPQAVVDWFPNNNPTQVLVKESADMRGDITDTEADRNRDTYILYTLEGWARYVDVDGNPEIIEQGEYAFYENADRDKRILPIFPVELPMPRQVGYILSIKQNHIYNAKSIRDFSVRNMSFAFLQIVADENQYESILEGLKNGFRVIRKDPDASGEHGYKSPPSDYLTEAGEILEKDKEEFAESAFKSYGDAAKQVTATEIRQESRSGVEAFLGLLVSALDEFENHCLFLLEQIYFPDEPSRWGKAKVKRNTDFTPKDVEKALSEVSSAVRDAKNAGAMSTYRAVQLLNPEMSEEEIQEEVDKINSEQGASIPDPFSGD